MSALLVEAAGLCTTVQDFGRPGYGAMGISPSGAADPVALRIGNLLAGNDAGAAALEMTLTGGVFVFRDSGVFALAGSDFGAELNGRAAATWRAYRAAAGDRLTAGATRSGARCYLCAAGGISVEAFLGSASTHLVSGLGGFEGRMLRKGDVLDVGESRAEYSERALTGELHAYLQPRDTIRVTDGPQSDLFADSEKKAFTEGAFRVSEESNRLGLRLEGAAVRRQPAGEMITEGVSLGAIQITPSGQPILLFVEQQTTGGYPKIANVIAADLFRVGQLRPRDTIRFQRVSFAEARAALIEQERLLAVENLFV